MFKKVLIYALLLLAGVIAGGGAIFLLNDRAMHIPTSPFVPASRPAVPEWVKKPGSVAFSGIVNAVSPTVVNISTVKVMVHDTSYADDPFFDFFNDFFSPFDDEGPKRRWKEQGLGSGVIVSEDGYIITNNHVVADAEKIKVTLYDKRVFRGKVIGSDPKTDIAVVKIASDGLPSIPWGDSDGLSVGEFVLAIGNPFGLSHTVTMGIISAVGRADVGIADYEDFIQTDAAINPGNSGGPLVDTMGRLIGINTAIFSKSGGYQGIGFAVPSNMARLIKEHLLREGKVIRGWLGVTIQELTPEFARKFGLKTSKGTLVSEAIAGSPARKAGVRRGDIILRYDGKDVPGPSTLRNMVAQSKPGERVPIKILRDRKILNMVATVGEPPAPQEAERAALRPPSDTERDTFSGLSVMTLTEDIARQLGLGSEERGVVVIGVQEGSPADEAGISRGDVIHEVDRKKVRSIEDFERIVSERDPDESALVYIKRGERSFYFLVPSS
jgi:serine protease Do